MKSSFLLKGTALISGLSAVLLMSSCSSVQPVGLGKNDATQTAATKPGTPSNLKATANAGLSSIVLTWTRNNPKTETQFKIDWHSEGAKYYGYPGLDNTSAGVTSYQFVDYAEDLMYYFRVCADNSAGHSAWSNEVKGVWFSMLPVVTTYPTIYSIKFDWSGWGGFKKSYQTGFELGISYDNGSSWTSNTYSKTTKNQTVNYGIGQKYRIRAVAQSGSTYYGLGDWTTIN
jgi:hypothetical protein